MDSGRSSCTQDRRYCQCRHGNIDIRCNDCRSHCNRSSCCLSTERTSLTNCVRAECSMNGNCKTRLVELTYGVDHVMPNGGAFAAVKHDGSVVTWDHPHF